MLVNFTRLFHCCIECCEPFRIAHRGLGLLAGWPRNPPIFHVHMSEGRLERMQTAENGIDWFSDF